MGSRSRHPLEGSVVRSSPALVVGGCSTTSGHVDERRGAAQPSRDAGRLSCNVDRRQRRRARASARGDGGGRRDTRCRRARPSRPERRREPGERSAARPLLRARDVRSHPARRPRFVMIAAATERAARASLVAQAPSSGESSTSAPPPISSPRSTIRGSRSTRRCSRSTSTSTGTCSSRWRRATTFVMPDEFQRMIGNAFDNINPVPRWVNNLLQRKYKGFWTEMGRFLINSTARHRRALGHRQAGVRAAEDPRGLRADARQVGRRTRAPSSSCRSCRRSPCATASATASTAPWIR